MVVVRINMKTKIDTKTLTAGQMRRWNGISNADGDAKFTKKDHSEALNFGTYEMAAWNEAGQLPKYTQEEHMAKIKFAREMRIWNHLKSSPKYTKEQHSKAPHFDAYEARWWNIQGLKPRYTKEEHAAAKDCTIHEIYAWNSEPNPDKYTAEELANYP